MKLEGLFILENRKPAPCEDFLEHAAWMEEHWRDRIVAITFVFDGVTACEVHTCFLGMDLQSTLFPGRAPTLFETCVFSGANRSGEVLEIERCSTWNEAVLMHERLTQKYKDNK